MANSPGPSSSSKPDVVIDKNSPFSSTASKKKKKNRRKPRNKARKQEEDDTDTSLVEFTPNFVIQTVKQSCGVAYKCRDLSNGPIKLKSFIQNGRIPCVFQTPGCDNISARKVLETLHNLKINGLSLSSSDKSSHQNYTEKKSSKKKKGKKAKLFPQYVSEKEVAIGLRNNTFMKGSIRINPKHFKESYVGNEDVTKSDYVITSVLDRNRALEGDEVIIKLKTITEENKKLMEVVHITKQVHPRTAIGVLEPLENNKDFALFVPRDKRIPKMKIPKISWPSGFQADPELYADILFLAKIQDWKEVKYALGTIIENLGFSKDLKVQSLSILREFNLDPTPYGDDMKQYLPKTCDIPPEEFKYRADFRKACIFTIDPKTARDLDDAVSCIELSNGNFEVGVHISDASFFLKENTPLDKKVKNRATTIYMVDSVYHMLPEELCLLCSLLPGQDKLAFSVIWELTPEGDIVKYKITRSIINSCVQLSYEDAQLMIDTPNKKIDECEVPKIHNGFKPEHLCQVVNNLQKIAVCLREKRQLSGALKIDQIKISFFLDPATGEPLDFFVNENLAAHRLIEEFMLLANRTVATFINKTFPDLAFLRCHEAPKSPMMVDLQKNLETVGMHIDISSSGGIQASLNKYGSGTDVLSQARRMVLNHLIAKAMKRARYFCAGSVGDDVSYTHYALSIPLYTHFTSPIRRYADIMVHRLLAASLNYCKKPKWNPKDVAEIAENCNRQKYFAKKAGDASSDLYLVHFIEKRTSYVEDAVVLDTKERSIDVITLKTGTVVRIYTNNFGENLTWRSEEIKIARLGNDDENVKKMWKIYVNFPKTQTEPEFSMILEMFTLLRVELSRKGKTNQLEGKLLRPEQEYLNCEGAIKRQRERCFVGCVYQK